MEKTESNNPVRHLYVHFPFCARICPYCAFYKTRGTADDFTRFCSALLVEARRISNEIPLSLETIFFGGGTPTALSTTATKSLLQGFADVFDLRRLEEWTVEANPGSVSARKADVLKAGGVTRISLGVQTWNDELLKLLGREHDAAQARQSFAILRNAGFTNINLDLMFALPVQTEASWRDSIEKTIVLAPEHISTYCLTYEEDTEFLSRFRRGEFQREEAQEAQLLETAITLLQAADYEHYEISNYARSGFRSLHNQAYWRGADYVGLGPSAFSTHGLRRWQNVAHHGEYARRLAAGQSPIDSVEQLTPAMKRTERIALGLRTRAGVAAELTSENRAADLIANGLLVREGSRLVLTNDGQLLADAIAAELI